MAMFRKNGFTPKEHCAIESSVQEREVQKLVGAHSRILSHMANCKGEDGWGLRLAFECEATQNALYSVRSQRRHDAHHTQRPIFR